MIELRNIAKNYNGTTALQEVNLKVAAGEIFGLLGPNGAGKTTAIKILTGQLKPDAGQAYIYEKNIQSHREDLLSKMGIVPENTNLYERLTILENLKFYCRLYNQDYSLIDHYLKLVDLQDFKSRAVKKLSRGMKQKVLLIRALLHEPDILFLDEPTSGLDPGSAAVIHKILQQLNEKGITILLTSHNMEEVDKLCHRVAFLHQGRLVEEGTPQKLKLQYSSSDIKIVYREEGQVKEKIFDMTQRDRLAQKLSLLITQERLLAIHSQEPSLADIFVTITGKELT